MPFDNLSHAHRTRRIRGMNTTSPRWPELRVGFKEKYDVVSGLRAGRGKLAAVPRIVLFRQIVIEGSNLHLSGLERRDRFVRCLDPHVSDATKLCGIADVVKPKFHFSGTASNST